MTKDHKAWSQLTPNFRSLTVRKYWSLYDLVISKTRELKSATLTEVESEHEMIKPQTRNAKKHTKSSISKNTTVKNY